MCLVLICLVTIVHHKSEVAKLTLNIVAKHATQFNFKK